MRRTILIVSLLLGGGACSDGPSGLRLDRALEGLSDVDVTVGASELAVFSGATIDLVASATNHGSQRVQLGIACGPNFDVLVRYPNGDEHSALADFIGPDGAFTCPLLPTAFADPGQTRTERIKWHAASLPGQYVIQAGLRRGDGLSNLSEAVVITVF